MDYPIDAQIELINDNLGNMTVQVEKANHSGCYGCAFSINYNGCTRHNYHLDPTSCSKIFRKDKTNIIFKRIK